MVAERHEWRIAKKPWMAAMGSLLSEAALASYAAEERTAAGVLGDDSRLGNAHAGLR
jgi:hypothetical protein